MKARNSVLNINTNYGSLTKQQRDKHENHLAQTRSIQQEMNYHAMADSYNKNKN